MSSTFSPSSRASLQHKKSEVGDKLLKMRMRRAIAEDTAVWKPAFKYWYTYFGYFGTPLL